MKNNEYYQEVKPELDYYLWNLDANKEERRCTRMWVRDGHCISDNDHPYRYDGPVDFLTAAREASSCGKEYTDSFYDPLTQEYIRELNPTRYEMKKLREYIRNGGRFCDDFDGFNTDYITYLRTENEIIAAMFDSEFNYWISRYGADYLVKNKQLNKFMEFLETKEDYSTYKATGSLPGKESDNDELPF